MAKPTKNKKAQGSPQVVSVSGGSAGSASAAHAADHGHVGHIVPMYVLAGTFGGLVVLTILTVALSGVPLGRLNLWVTLLIAGMKAALVVFFFMHLKWDRPLNAVIFITSLTLVILFIGFAMTDSETYQPDIAAWSSAQP
jgi:cytochrome c oxidase subunit 4